MGISPKEAFEAVKILWPQVTGMRKYGDRWVAWDATGYEVTHSNTGVMVDWGNTTVYPLPEPKWRDARPEDLAYPFKTARFRDRDVDTWLYSELRGIAGDTGKIAWPWLASGGRFYAQCQVRDES